MADPNDITPPQLLRLIGLPDAPAIVDISIDPEFADDPHLIPGAYRHPHTDLPGPEARRDLAGLVRIPQSALPDDVFGNQRGPRCTFDTMLDEFALHTPALDRLAQVTRAADTNAHDLAAEAAGVLAFSVGLSRQFKGDQDQLAAGLPLYDALLRSARDSAGEGHDWPPGHAQ